MTIDPATQMVADQIALILRETEEQPRYYIARIIQVCGVKFAEKMLRKTLDCEAQGGLMTHDRSRRRTPGGVFFYFVRGYLRSRRKRALWKARIQKLSDVFPELVPMTEDNDTTSRRSGHKTESRMS